MKKHILFLLMLFIATSVVEAQKSKADTIIDMHKAAHVKTELVKSDSTDTIRELTTMNSIPYNLSKMVLAFGLIVILLETVLILKQKIQEENIVRFIVVTLIITASLFLITAGYSNNQIAPATGLLGAIAGYLLGKTDKPKDNEKPEK